MTASSGVAGSSPLPKWQLALVVGAPVALGLGYMYYRNRNSNNIDKPERDKFRSGAAKENGAPADKQISIDGDCPPKVPSLAAESEVKTACYLEVFERLRKFIYPKLKKRGYFMFINIIVGSLLLLSS